MKDKELKLKETEASHTQGGSDTLRYINLAEVALGLVGCVDRCTCACVSEERGDSQVFLYQGIS
jgi:hypothetical protein